MRFFITILLIVPFSVLAQSARIDSLQHELKSANGAEEAELLIELGNTCFQQGDSLTARQYTDKGINTAIGAERQDLEQKGKLLHAFMDDSYGRVNESMDQSLEVLYSGVELMVEDSAMVIGLIGTALTKLGAYELAIEYRKKLVDINTRHDRDNPYYPVENIAFLFADMQEFDSANYYYHEALKIAKEQNRDNWVMHCLNNMGHNYYIQGNQEQSRVYYQQAIDHFLERTPTRRDSILYGAVLGNIGQVEMDQNKLEKALEWFTKADSVLQPTDQSLWVQNSIRLAGVEVKLANVEGARSRLEMVEPYIANSKAHTVEYYLIMSSYYETIGDAQMAIEALREVLLAKQEIEKEKQLNRRVNDFMRYQTDRIQKELELQQQLRENNERISSLQLQLTLGISGAVVVILLILFFKYRKDQRRKVALTEMQNKLKEAELENQKMKSEQLSQELSNKNKDLTDFAIDITRKDDFVEVLLEKLKTHKSTIEDQTYKELLQFTKGHKIINKNMKMFQDNVDKVNHEFMSLLTNRFPDLTNNEKQLCSLIRLQLSSKEIATIKSISPDSVKVLRSRLRKKLGLQPEEDLQQFIINLA